MRRPRGHRPDPWWILPVAMRTNSSATSIRIDHGDRMGSVYVLGTDGKVLDEPTVASTQKLCHRQPKIAKKLKAPLEPSKASGRRCPRSGPPCGGRQGFRPSFPEPEKSSFPAALVGRFRRRKSRTPGLTRPRVGFSLRAPTFRKTRSEPNERP